LCLHLGIAGAFAYVTQLAFGREQPPPGPVLPWLLGWCVLGAASAASLLMGVLGDWRWLVRAAGRGLALAGGMGLAAWLAGTASSELWEPLSLLTFESVAAVLGWLGFELRMDTANAILELSGFAVSVAPVCSGFEGIGLFVVLFAGFVFHQRAKLCLWRALLVLPLGMVVMWLGNVARISSLMLIGARIDPGIAIGSFHSKAGWIFFSAITLGFALIVQRLAWFSRAEKRDVGESSDNPAVPLLLPVLAWIGIGLVTSAFSDGHDPLYGVRVIVVGVLLWAYRKHYRQWLNRPTMAAWVIGALVGIAWLVIPFDLPPIENQSPAPGETWAAPWFSLWVVLRCLGAIVIIPLCEELAFRGYLARRLARRDFWELPLTHLPWFGMIGSSLIFGAVHGRWVLGTFTGIIFALLVRRSGRLADAIVAHAVSNAVIAAWVVAMGDWKHW
jgi:exosortase E/protease (VPEID-CTERM system)